MPCYTFSSFDFHYVVQVIEEDCVVVLVVAFPPPPAATLTGEIVVVDLSVAVMSRWCY